MRESSREKTTTLVAMLVVSIVVHLLVWPLSSIVMGGGRSQTIPKAGGAMEVALIEPEEPLDPEAEERRLLEEEEGKLVQLDRVTDERPPDADTKQFSEFDNRTDHETRAPMQRPQPGAAPTVQGDRPDGRHGQSTQSSDSHAKPLSLLPSADADGDNDGKSKSDTPTGETSDAPRAPGRLGSLSPAGSPGTRQALMKSLGQPGTMDDLTDIDEGDENILNSKRWKYASFFNRVRNAVAQHWHPEVVHAARDPDGSVYGMKTRRTKLIISLNEDGSLHEIELESGSGVDYLDEEAIRAVRTAAPFANPPPGLVDPKSGHIVFGFGFIFEIHGGTRIFRYQR